MIQMETILNVADNSGASARKGPLVAPARYAGLADVIIGRAVQEATQVVR